MRHKRFALDKIESQTNRLKSIIRSLELNSISAIDCIKEMQQVIKQLEILEDRISTSESEE